MVKEYTTRPLADSDAERQYLEQRLAEIDRDYGVVAARLGVPSPITQELDVLDRARELVADLIKQVQVISLDEAVDARLAWLERVEAQQNEVTDEPKPDLNRIVVDRRLLQDVRAGWQATQQ